jgi:hypothetical protein
VGVVFPADALHSMQRGGSTLLGGSFLHHCPRLGSPGALLAHFICTSKGCGGLTVGSPPQHPVFRVAVFVPRHLPRKQIIKE